MNFEQQFNKFQAYIKTLSRRYSAATGIPYAEFESALNEEFFLKFEGYKEGAGKFSAYMRVVLTQRASREANRKERKFYDAIEYIDGQAQENGDGEEAATLEIPSEYDLEGNEVIRQGHNLIRLHKKTDADKRQLINALVENSDSLTTAIVNEYLVTTDARPTAIGKTLGIHHEIVSRKLRRLARNFNESQFGKINDYLAV